MDEQCQLPAPWRYKKYKQAWYHTNNPFTKNYYNLKLAKDSFMSWSSWERWMSVESTWRLKLKTNVMGTLLKLHSILIGNSFQIIFLTSLDLNLFSKTWNKSWYIHIVTVEAKSSQKTKSENFFLWNSLIFMLKHGDELSGRFKMRLTKIFIIF